MVALFEKPENVINKVFTPDELDEEKTGLCMGYSRGSLIPGPDFSKPFKNVYERGQQKIIEKFNGTAKRRAACKEINKFGWAKYQPSYSKLEKDSYVFHPGTITFGLKYVNHANNNRKLGKLLQKWEQVLRRLLLIAGWKNVKRVGDNTIGHEYVITLDNEEDIRNLYELSSSIGFYYKAHRPELEDLKEQAFMVQHQKEKANIGRGGRTRGR